MPAITTDDDLASSNLCSANQLPRVIYKSGSGAQVLYAVLCFLMDPREAVREAATACYKELIRTPQAKRGVQPAELKVLDLR